jgi:hypothetical protein
MTKDAGPCPSAARAPFDWPTGPDALHQCYGQLGHSKTEPHYCGCRYEWTDAGWQKSLIVRTPDGATASFEVSNQARES